ncbi:trypsin-like peptidase domain-containing protein [Paraburkholderia caribensis]|uniref:trypsin-like peptidase domain-containing protein n=1 Tax=Paraburkholderia caribensis TaxID=75105 RepID=UPI0031E23CB5
MNTTLIYRSPNGDRWLLCSGEQQAPFVRHVANAPSGGAVSDVSVDAFLNTTGDGYRGPQQDALHELLSAGTPASSALVPERQVQSDVQADSLLLSVVQVRTFVRTRRLTGASGFLFARGDRLFLVTSRHVMADTPSQHFPDRLEMEMHVDPSNLGASAWISLPLYVEGMSLWRQAADTGGEIDVALLEIPRAQLPRGAVFRAFGPEHIVTSGDSVPIGASVLIVGFPLSFHDSLHHLPVVRHGVVASTFGLRFQGKGCFITDARTHRGTSGAPVVIRRSSNRTGAQRDDLSWGLLGVHSTAFDMGTRDLHVDESLGLNCAWYADVLTTLSEDCGKT